MFMEINNRFPMVLFPSFHLQDNLQESTLGACVDRQDIAFTALFGAWRMR